LLLIGTKFDLKKQQQKDNWCKADLNIISRMKFPLFKQQKQQLETDVDTSLINSANALSIDFYFMQNNRKESNVNDLVNINDNFVLMDNKPIKRRECIKLSKLINAKKYIECSSYDTKSVHKVMSNAIKYAFNYKKDKSDNIMPYLYLINKIFNEDKVSNDIKNPLSNSNVFHRRIDDRSVTMKSKTKLNCFCCTNRSTTCDSIYESKI
jgi:hypothetical protein